MLELSQVYLPISWWMLDEWRLLQSWDVHWNEEEDSVTCAGSSLVFLYFLLSANAIEKGNF